MELPASVCNDISKKNELCKISKDLETMYAGLWLDEQEVFCN